MNKFKIYHTKCIEKSIIQKMFECKEFDYRLCINKKNNDYMYMDNRIPRGLILTNDIINDIFGADCAKFIIEKLKNNFEYNQRNGYQTNLFSTEAQLTLFLEKLNNEIDEEYDKWELMDKLIRPERMIT